MLRPLWHKMRGVKAVFRWRKAPLVVEPAEEKKEVRQPRAPPTPQQLAARAARGAKKASKVEASQATHAVARTERAVYRDIEEQARERDEARLVVTRAAAERAGVARRKAQRVLGDARRLKRMKRRAVEAADSCAAQLVAFERWPAIFHATWSRRRTFRQMRRERRTEHRAEREAARAGDLATARELKKRKKSMAGALAERVKAMAQAALVGLGLKEEEQEEVVVVKKELDPKERALRMHRKLLRKAGFPRRYAKDLPMHRKDAPIFLGAAAQAIEDAIAHQRSEAWLRGRRDLLRDPRDIVEARLREVEDVDVVNEFAKRVKPDHTTIGLEAPQKPMVGFADPVGRYSKSSGGEDYFHYVGEWDRGAMEGQGAFTFYDGATYSGAWMSNRQEGEGVAQYKPHARPANAVHDADVTGSKKKQRVGPTYEGQWSNGKYDGKGKLTSENGTTYDGEWVEGVKHGYGVQKYKSGQVYEGKFSWGQREGHGVLISSTGYSYAGDWSNGFIEGWGALMMSDKDISLGKKRKSIVRFWERSTLRELIQMRHADAEWEQSEKKDEYKWLLAPLQELRLQKLVDNVHARMEGEKKAELARLKAEEDRLKRERREKVLQARKEAIAALAAGGGDDSEDGGDD